MNISKLALLCLLLSLCQISTAQMCSDTVLLTCVINSEAAGESYEEKLRIGNVVLNRILSNRYPNTMEEVIFQKYQFSGTNSKLFRHDPEGDRGDKESLRAAKAILSGERVLSENIIGFFNEERSTNKKFVAKIQTKVIFTTQAHSYFRS